LAECPSRPRQGAGLTCILVTPFAILSRKPKKLLKKCKLSILQFEELL
jgi:hypothetical protein